MKLKFKIASVLTAALISVSSIGMTAFGQEQETTAAEQETPAVPALGAGAFCTGVAVEKSGGTKIKEGDTVNVIVTTYIPIENFDSSLTTGYFDTENIFGLATGNDSFTCLTSYSWSDNYYITGSFLRVDSKFIDVVYQGKGNQFSYSICYNANGSSTNVPLTCQIADCIETVPEEEEPEDNSVPSFTLAPGNSYTINAGASQTITLKLNSLGQGSFSTVTAMLSSADSDIIVEDIGEKTSASLSPMFSFRISAPKNASEGVHNLTLSVNVYDKKGNPAGSNTYTIPVNVKSDVKASALTVKSYETDKKIIRSGDNFKLSLTLANKCGIDLENVEVSLVGLDSSKFVLDGGFSKQTVTVKNGKAAKVTFPMVACDGISFVRESIGVQAVYSINDQSPNSLETSVIINCEPKKEEETEHKKYDLTMTSYNVSSSAVAENTRFTLSLTLENDSDKKIENARLSLMGLDGNKFAINSGLTYKDFEIGAGKSKKFSFEIIGCEGISSIREVIPVLIEYGTVSSEVNVTVSCVPKENKEEEEGQVFAPNIIIENYDYGGEFVTAGQTFPLKVTVKNTSSEAVIENLKITVNGGSTIDGGIAYSPANSTNSFFFETLGIKQSTELALDLLAKADAAPNSYPVEISFTYEYAANGKHYQASPVNETLTIPLQQEDRLSVNQPDYPNYAVNVGEMCYISTSLVNKGKSGVYNVTATIEGEGFDVSSGATYYIGNINSGSEEYYDAQVTPNMEGDIKGEIIITYEDANGSEKEQRLPFSFTAVQFNYDDMGMDPGYMDPGFVEEMPPEDAGGFPWIPVVIGAAVIIAIVIIIIVVVKKRKRKKELEDENEDI